MKISYIQWLLLQENNQQYAPGASEHHEKIKEVLGDHYDEALAERAIREAR